jgi:hypothetical protein
MEVIMHIFLRSTLLLVTLLGTACTTAESPISATLPADALHRIVLDVERGDVTYAPNSTAEVSFHGRSWGRGRDMKTAEKRHDTVRFIAMRDGHAAVARGYSNATSAGTDIDAYGPAHVDVTLETHSGTARLVGVTGRQVVRADEVDVRAVRGSIDIEARSRVDAEVIAGVGDHVQIAASGDVFLELPFGLDYDLQIWGDPAYALEVHDLGFDAVYGNAGYFAATAGSATTRVDITVTGGRIQIIPARSW